jgi:hypothetical protein
MILSGAAGRRGGANRVVSLNSHISHPVHVSRASLYRWISGDLNIGPAPQTYGRVTIATKMAGYRLTAQCARCTPTPARPPLTRLCRRNAKRTTNWVRLANGRRVNGTPGTPNYQIGEAARLPTTDVMHAQLPFGPFMIGVDPTERTAQLRALRALTRVFAGEVPAVELLRRAERDESLSSCALEEFDRIPALARRRILSSFSALHRPPR